MGCPHPRAHRGGFGASLPVARGIAASASFFSGLVEDKPAPNVARAVQFQGFLRYKHLTLRVPLLPLRRPMPRAAIADKHP